MEEHNKRYFGIEQKIIDDSKYPWNICISYFAELVTIVQEVDDKVAVKFFLDWNLLHSNGGNNDQQIIKNNLDLFEKKYDIYDIILWIPESSINFEEFNKYRVQ